MATASGNIKEFYRQRKKSGVSKPSNSKPSSSSSTKNKKLLKNAATFGSDFTQPAALISHGSPDLKDDFDENEDMLRKFDMNMAHGPCLGMTRLARWERARSLGLNPPEGIEGLLKSGKVRSDCLWDGRI